MLENYYRIKLFSLLLLPILLLSNTKSYAQRWDTVSVFNMPIILDTFIVKSGFDVEVFIKRVQQDTSFYKAFKSMHLKQYQFINVISVLDKNNKVAASYTSRAKQIINKRCRITKIITQQSTGNFYRKNGDYTYFTAELYDFLFLTKKPACNETDIVAGALDNMGRGQMEKNKYELKQLIFNPGSKVEGIPFIGKKASIFDDGEKGKYNFKIWIDTLLGQDCYVFKITPKDAYKNKVVYNELTTWFRVSDYSILARNYALSYSTLFYDFDVIMKVRTILINNKLYPICIDYDGNWHIATKKRERVKFNISISY